MDRFVQGIRVWVEEAHHSVLGGDVHSACDGRCDSKLAIRNESHVDEIPVDHFSHYTQI